MRRISISSLGQLADADIDFGDVTVFVGPQASGKSITLQLLKLVLDHGHITKALKRQGYDWKGDINDFMSLYFSEGMQRIWQESTSALVDGQKFDLSILSQRGRKKNETLQSDW